MARIEGGDIMMADESLVKYRRFLEEAQLLGPHDQNVYEYPGAFPEMVVAPFGGR